MDGLILVQKPKGFTSHDIVSLIRKTLNEKKVGHFGTLDPSATGLLLVAVGKATRLFPFYLRSDKTYEGRIRLGFATDTYDSEGNPVSEESKNYPDKKTLIDHMKRFMGEIAQVPPPYSAKKYKGQPLYKLVRRREEFKLKSNKVFVRFFKLKEYSPPHIFFEIKCSSGTYIRSIAHDLGQNLNCGAHLDQLVRTAIGEFHIRKSHTIEKIKELASSGRTKKFLEPMETLLPEFPKIVVDDRTATLVQNGSEFIPDSIPDTLFSEEKASSRGEKKQAIFRIFDSQGKLLAFATFRSEGNSLHPFVVFDSITSP